MDLFAGSEPRRCISFRLDKEQNGQLSRSGSVDDKELSIQDTTPQTTQVSTESNEPDNRLQTLTLAETASVPQQDSEMTSESNEPDHKSFDSSGGLVAEYQREETVGDCDPSEIEQDLLTRMTNTGHTASHSAQQSSEPNKETALQDSSSSQESCEAYFTRRMEELGGKDYDLPIQEVTVLGAKESCTEPLELNPGLNKATYGDPLNVSLPPDVLLDTEHNYVADP